MERRQLFGNAVDQILALEDVSESTSSADRVLWPLADHIGTVRDLVQNDGILGEHYEYDSYGQMISGDTSLTRYLFTGREYDADTGMQYNRARWYDAEVGRWISRDPIGFDAGDTNLSRYVGNSVPHSIDPSGLINPADSSSMQPADGSSNEWWNAFSSSYDANPWNGSSTPRVDALDSALYGATFVAQGGAAVAGTMLVGFAALYYAGISSAAVVVPIQAFPSTFVLEMSLLHFTWSGASAASSGATAVQQGLQSASSTNCWWVATSTGWSSAGWDGAALRASYQLTSSQLWYIGLT